MPKRFLIQIIASLGKSVYKAYKNVSKGQSAAPENPYTEWLRKTMQSTNILETPMTEAEAAKILNLGDFSLSENDKKKADKKIEELQLENQQKIDLIMNKYVLLFNKNSQKNGGSPYIQSKIFNSKEFLMKNFVKEEKVWYQVNQVDEETLIKKGEEDAEKKEEKDEKEEKEKEEKESEGIKQEKK